MKKILFILCLGLLLVNVSCTFTNESVKKGTIDITVDTDKLTAQKVGEADWYTVSVKNSSDLLYIVVTIKITDNNYVPKKCKLVVNGEEIDSKKYTIEDKTITYKIEDTHWSDFI